MKSQTVVVSVALLALCCLLLIPREGESTGGIVSLQQSEEERQTGDLLQEESLDDPESEQGLIVDPHPLGSSSKAKRDTEEASQADRIRRAPEEGKKKKKDKKKNKEPKDPNATKKPKTDKKGKKKDRKTTTTTTTTTLPPTTTVIPTEPPTEPEPYTDYLYPDIDDDYSKPDYEYWEADPTPSRPQPEAPITDPSYDYWKPEEEDPAAPVTDVYDDYWKPEKEPATPVPDIYDDYWKPEEKEPAAPVTDNYDDYWKPEEKEPATPVPDIYDDYWKPEEKEPAAPVTDNYDDYWKPEEKEPVAPVTDNYDSYWKEEDPTPPAPEVDGKTGTDDKDYWDATFETPDNLPFPDGKEVSPEIEVETLPERAQKLKEAEDRARNRPRVFKEPKKCPPLGMESHKIEPDQLSASSVSQYNFSPQRARLNMQGSDDDDNARGGAWCANSDDRAHWFEIDARRETEFTGVITQGRNSLNENDYVISYFLAFSNDTREWTTIHDGYADWLFFGNSDKDTPVMNQLAVPVVARYIRIIPQSWNGTLCMRLEVLGCPLPDPATVQYRQNEVTPVDYLEFKHHSYSEMVSLMKSVNEECPNITSIYSLGQSSKGLEIMAMVISGNPTEHEIGEPEFRFTAGLHGNEAVGREMILLLMQYLCKEYKDRNPRAQRLVEAIRIHLVPSLNPDGHEEAFESGSELSGWTTGHFTENGADIFQNFPDLNSILWDAEDKGMVPKLTPNHHVPIPENFETNSSIAVETRAIISWMKSYPFVLGANFQGGERLVAYPYDSLRMSKSAESQEPRSRKKRQYEEEGFDVTEWGRGYHEEPEEDWRGRGYAEPEEEWRGHGYDHDRGYDHGYDHGYEHGYGHREEEEDDRGRGGGYHYAEPDDEPRVTADESLFRWLAVSYASTHLTMTHNYHGSCQGDTATFGHGIVNRAKWKPVTGTPTGDYWRLLNPGEYRVTARAEGFSAVTKLCVVGYQSGATACSFNLAKSNWDRIKQIMALHGNKPIRLLSHGNTRAQYPVIGNSNRRVVDGYNGYSENSRLSSERQRRLRIARIRRLRQQKLLRLRSMTTTLPPTTTTLPTTPETTTFWYDSWPIEEGQSSTPGGFTDSIIDYNYEYKIDDY
ncbi:hypothetical protein PAMP_022271 [Pampus punctatissimus]